MKVSELIEKLETFDPDYDVGITYLEINEKGLMFFPNIACELKSVKHCNSPGFIDHVVMFTPKPTVERNQSEEPA